MNRSHAVTRSISVGLLAAGLVVIFYPASAADRPDSEQVSKLLSEVKSQAFQVKQDAYAMESYTRSGDRWESHATVVNQMRDPINEAGKELAKLEEAKKSASPWQRTAIDRIQPLLKELAANIELVIKYIDDNPKRLFMEQYKDYLEANADVPRILRA